tara:strand:- start:1735 stop:1989 length:255 start_codon:yes stop_codon:yes gene_type:complete
MAEIGDLVKNVDYPEYNYGVILEVNLNMTDELMASGADLDLTDLESACSGFEPPSVRIFWESGEICAHYLDELEVVNEISIVLE